MIKKFKQWVVYTFLPAYAKELYKAKCDELLEKEAKIRELEAYIRGLEAAGRRITINNNIKGGDR
jgi:hypothetical protein